MDPELINDSVHCGFCLPTCPTYALWGEEMDSPRGRIHLMKQHVEGTPMTPEMAGHFDACLGCMACVTACPSGVQYDRLIEQTRVVVEREHVREPRERAVRGLVFSLFPYPRRLRLLRPGMWLAERLAPFLGRDVPEQPFPWENRDGEGTYRAAKGGLAKTVAGLASRAKSRLTR